MKIKIFLDSSVIISALISAEGASRQVLTLCEALIAKGIISNKVIEEINHVIKAKLPEIQADFDEFMGRAKFEIIRKISSHLVKEAEGWISDLNDAPILAAAKFAKADVVLTLDIRHFIRDAGVSKKSGLKIMTPGEFLNGFWKIV